MERQIEILKELVERARTLGFEWFVGLSSNEDGIIIDIADNSITNDEMALIVDTAKKYDLDMWLHAHECGISILLKG